MNMAVTPGKRVGSMKRLHCILALAASALALACSSVDERMDISRGRVIDRIEASIAVGESRTSAVAGADGTLQMLWHASDRIAVTDRAGVAQFALKSGAKRTEATFGGSIITDAATVYAVYPASAATVESGVVKAAIPRVQSFSPAADGNVGARNLMVGTSDDNLHFTFHTVASVARFDVAVDDDESVTSVTMRVEGGHPAGCGEVDLDNCSLGELDCDRVTLCYTAPATGRSADGWALVAPLDFTQIGGNVYYDVTTSKGLYTFCRKPAKAFAAGVVYRFPLHKDSFEEVDSPARLSDGKYCFTPNDGTLTVRLLHASDTTLSVAWSDNGFEKDYNHDHKIALYDSAGGLVAAWHPNQSQSIDGNKIYYATTTIDTTLPGSRSTRGVTYTLVPTRFVFSGLTPDTQYRVQATNLLTGVSSAMADVTTAPTDCGEVVHKADVAGDVILFENFGEVVWSGDRLNTAAGYISSQYDSLTDIAEGTARGDQSGDGSAFKYTRYDHEAALFTTLRNVLGSCGLAGWGYLCDAGEAPVYAHPGYVRVGTESLRAALVTPELSALPAPSRVRVSFLASSCREGAATAPTLTVSVADGTSVEENRVSGGDLRSQQSVELQSAVGWRRYSVELDDAKATSRIMICGDNADFYIDDIKVEYLERMVAATVCGAVYGDGSPLENVVVSDGFRCTRTDADGVFALDSDLAKAKFVYVVQPSGYAVPCSGGLPHFWQRLGEAEVVDDMYSVRFDLQSVENPDRFTMIFSADPQPRKRTAGYDRFAYHSLDMMSDLYSDIAEYTSQITDRAVYGVVLGDLVHEKMDLYPNYMDELGKMDFPTYSVIGNHDNNPDVALDADRPALTLDDLAAEVYESYLGPRNYSFNVGRIHVVVLDNLIMYANAEGQVKGYDQGLTDDVWEWLADDLSYVDYSTQVMVCAHSPMFRYVSGANTRDRFEWGAKENHGADYAELLSRYARVHAWAGHVHNTLNYVPDGTAPAGGVSSVTNVESHNLGRSTGDLWVNDWLTKDGTPRGYTVVEVDGEHISWHFKPVTRQSDPYNQSLPAWTLHDVEVVDNVIYRNGAPLDGSYQMRAYPRGTYDDNYVYVNVFLWDEKWELPVFHSPKSGSVTMERVSGDKAHDAAARQMYEWYKANISTLAGNDSYDFELNSNRHIFRCPSSASSDSGTITVRDRFGNDYSTTVSW